jgi:hypothetical protein
MAVLPYLQGALLGTAAGALVGETVGKITRDPYFKQDYPTQPKVRKSLAYALGGAVLGTAMTRMLYRQEAQKKIPSKVVRQSFEDIVNKHYKAGRLTDEDAGNIQRLIELV